MAGDWIKMRVGLTTNPRVMRLAECLIDDASYMEWAGLTYGVASCPAPSESEERAERHSALRVTRYVTVTALLRFWGYANEHVKGEFIAGILPEDVDEIVGVPGFAHAISAAGWAEFDPRGGLSMPNFAEHNTSAGERSGAAERQKRYREKLKTSTNSDASRRDVTRYVTVTHREEKSREEKKDQKLSNPKGLEVGIPSDQPAEPDGKETEAKRRKNCPVTRIVALYHECLPNNPTVEKVTDARAGYIRQRWLDDLPTLDAWKNYFEYVGKSAFLTGRTQGRDGKAPFVADIEFLTKPASFTKTAEGKYHR